MNTPTDMWTCMICGNQVSKRQSVAYQAADAKYHGRACRCHPEAMKQAQERQAAADSKQKSEAAHINHMMHRKPHPYDVDIPKGPSCWHCHQQGISAQDHWLKMMVANEKCALQGKTIFDRDALKEAYGPVIKVLLLVPVPRNHAVIRATRDGDMFYSMSAGHMFLCGDCARKFGLEEAYGKVLSPEVKPETLKAMMMISDSLPITKAVKATAAAEMEIDKGNIPVMEEKEIGD